MTKGKWFSAKLRFAVLIETEGLVRYADSLHLFRSREFDQAFKRALEIGRNNEQSYLNGDGHKVVWKLERIVTLDIVRARSLDGAEVYSEFVSAADPNLPVEHTFSPE